MESFDKWFRKFGIPDKVEAAPALEPEELPPGIVRSDSGGYLALCCMCDGWYALPCELHEFDADTSYCGRSPRCCP